jgi:hypothetical protein
MIDHLIFNANFYQCGEFWQRSIYRKQAVEGQYTVVTTVYKIDREAHCDRDSTKANIKKSCENYCRGTARQRKQ